MSWHVFGDEPFCIMQFFQLLLKNNDNIVML